MQEDPDSALSAISDIRVFPNLEMEPLAGRQDGHFTPMAGMTL